MTVLVIGRTGQLARALDGIAGWQSVGREDADLAQPGAARQVIARVRPAWVVNAAAYTAVDRAESEPALAWRLNAEAVGEMAAAAAQVGAAFLHISTDYVFDGSKRGAWREDDPTRPLNTYGRTKLAGEGLALEANPRAVVLRTSWLYGPSGRNFLRTMLGLAAEKSRVGVVDDQRGNPTSALDLARACARVVGALENAPAADQRWGVYHFAGRGAVSWAGFARGIFAGAAARRLIATQPEVRPLTTADYPTAAARPANSTLDCNRFARAFGLAPRPWREQLAEVLDRLGAEVAP